MFGIPCIRYFRTTTLRDSAVLSCTGIVLLDPLDVTSPEDRLPLTVPPTVLRELVASPRFTVDISDVASNVSIGLEGRIFLVDRAESNTMFSQMAARCKAPSSGIVWPPQEFIRV